MMTTWNDVLKNAPRRGMGLNRARRDAIAKMLRAHPDWSNRRIARAVHLIIVTDEELDVPVESGPNIIITTDIIDTMRKMPLTERLAFYRSMIGQMTDLMAEALS